MNLRPRDPQSRALAKLRHAPMITVNRYINTLSGCKSTLKRGKNDAGGCQNQTSITRFYSAEQEHIHPRTFTLYADEPPALGGNDTAPNPVQHLLNALAACMTTSMVCHAAVHGIKIEQLESELEGDIDLCGFLGLSDKTRKGYTNIAVRFKVKTDEQNMERLKKLACRVVRLRLHYDVTVFAQYISTGLPSRSSLRLSI